MSARVRAAGCANGEVRGGSPPTAAGCRPLLARDMFTEPAATKTIAGELFISEAAVKQHLTNLFGKFGIAPDDENRRLRLANEAIRRGTVTISDLRDSTPS